MAGAVGAYLAGYENVSIYYLRDIVSGKKKCKYQLQLIARLLDIKSNAVKHIFVPFYEELTVKNILSEAGRYRQTLRYLPDGPDIQRVTR